MNRLVHHSVTATLFKMAVPMLAGAFAMNAYNLTDTWFVSQLGTSPLAAMAFSFPVVMVLRFIMMGLGTGALAIVARTLGSGDQDKAARLTTHALMLSLCFSALITVVGLWTVRPLFEMLGASNDVLAMVVKYMRIWYGGAMVMAVPSIMTQIILGTGDTKSASIAMMTGTLLNLILDPIMIFGWAGFPAMGISGAAVATILSQCFALLFPLYILTKKHALICWQLPSAQCLGTSWHSILRLGIPSILSNLLSPLSLALITRIVAGYGAEAVAATGATGRLEMFAFMIPMSIGMSLVPFVAQNYGAGEFDRIIEAQNATRKFALFYGAGISVLFFIFAPGMAGLFSNDPQVVAIMVRYIRIICFGYGMTESFRYSTFCLTGVHKPISSALLNLVRSFGLLVPLSYVGSLLWGLSGVFTARLLTDVVAASVAMVYSKKVITTLFCKESEHLT